MKFLRNIFSKKNQFSETDFDLLSSVIARLPDRYEYLEKQFTKELIVEKKPNELSESGTYRFSLDGELSEQFRDKTKEGLMVLRGISVWCKSKKDFVPFRFHVLDGLIVGYHCGADSFDVDFDQIELSELNEKRFGKPDRDSLISILGDAPKEVTNLLDISKTFKIEIDEGDFYVIKDLGDGNFLSINEDGEVHGMIHDPYEVELLFSSAKEFYEAVLNNTFSFERYLSEKFSRKF